MTNNTITVSIDLAHLLKIIYAESAWRYATQRSEGKGAALLDDDRQAIATEMIATAYAELISQLSAYVATHNLATFAQDEMLRLSLTYSSWNASAPTASLSNTIAHTIAARALTLCHPGDAHFAQMSARASRATLTVLARHEQQ